MPKYLLSAEERANTWTHLIPLVAMFITLGAASHTIATWLIWE